MRACHSGEYYTDQKQYKVGWTTGPDKGLSMDVPALNECWRTAPYLYDGRSYSMKDMLKVHGPHKPVTEKEPGRTGRIRIVFVRNRYCL
ncbi:hypothetical protein NXV33_09155 [Bacteroides thetaiotaomicron]|nr:hypothetical protein [Bacteroides thetaiotaomicron]